MGVNFAGPVAITRYNAGSYVNGEWTPNVTPTTTPTITGNIQGAGSKDVELIAREFGQHVDGLICLRTNEALYTAAKSPAKKADRVSYDGGTYEVIRTEHRATLPALEHYRSHARLLDPATEDASL